MWLFFRLSNSNFLFFIISLYASINIMGCSTIAGQQSKEKQIIQEFSVDSSMLIDSNNIASIKYNDEFNSLSDKIYVPPPLEGEVHKKKITNLQTLKWDTESFRLYAKHLRKHNDFDGLSLLKESALKFVKNNADPLLDNEYNKPNLDTLRLLATIRYLKAQLLYELKEPVKAKNEISTLKQDYSEYLDTTVDHVDNGYTSIGNAILEIEKSLSKSSQ